MRLDDLVREGLTKGAGSVRFDAARWTDSVTEAPRVGLPRAPRPPRRWVAAVAVAAVLVVGMGVPLALLAGLGGGDRGLRPGGSTVTGYGLSLELPAGWEGGVAGPRGSDYGPFLQAATRPLAPPESDPFATTTRQELAPDDVALVLIEYTESLAERGREPGENGNFPFEELPISIREGDFQPSFEGVSDLHDFARRTFTVNGRSFDLWVEFGQKPAPGGLVSAVNDVLATLRAEPAEGTSGHKTQADVDDGLSIQIPEPWTFHQDPSGPDDPRTIFAVGSWTFTMGGDCAPTAAQTELPSDGIFLWLVEYPSPAELPDFPFRPEHFELDEGTLAQYECSVIPSYLIRFQDAGRPFQVHVAFGPDASDSVKTEVLRALDSIEVTAPVPDACPAQTGPWADPDCPLPAWTHAIVRVAGYEVTGDTGSALVAEGLGGEFGVWAFPLDFDVQEVVDAEGYRKAYEIEGVQTYSDGVRMFWVAQGLAVWVSGWQVGEPAPGEPPPGPIVADLVTASQEVDYDAIDAR